MDSEQRVIAIAEQYLPLTEVAVMLDVSPSRIRHAARAGKIKSREGKWGLLVLADEVAELTHKPAPQGLPATRALRLAKRQRVRLPSQSAASQREQWHELKRELLRMLARLEPQTASRLTQQVNIASVTTLTVKLVLGVLEREGMVASRMFGRTNYYKLAGSAWPDEEVDVDAPVVVEAVGTYQQLEDSGWWEGELGASLQVGEQTYTPQLVDASLTLAAVYDGTGTAVYWLAATTGELVVSSGASSTQLPELLIPGTEGYLIGEPALQVARLFPPTMPEHALPRRERGRAAKRVGGESSRLGSLLSVYQQRHRLSYLALAAKLQCSRGVLNSLMLCAAPTTIEREGAAWQRYLRMVADIGGVPVSLLGEVLGEALIIEREI